MSDHPMKKLIKTANRMYLESYFSRVNWGAHLLPLIKVVVAEYSDTQRKFGPKELHLSEFHLSIASEDAQKGLFVNQQSEIWGDSIEASLGSRPIPARAVVPVNGRIKTLTEVQASLVFSQAVSGNVIALIYPPSSDVAMAKKPYFVVDMWKNPREIRPLHIRNLLRLTQEIDIYCSAAIFPNKKGARLLAWLHAKDSILAEGGSRIWVWIKNIFKGSAGVLRLYGIGKPTI